MLEIILQYTAELLLLSASVWLFFSLGRYLIGRQSSRTAMLDERLINPQMIQEAVKAYGRNTNSIVHLYGDLRFYSLAHSVNQATPSIIGYVGLDQQNIIVTDPLCATDKTKEALLEFARFSQAEEKDCLVFAINATTARQAAEVGFGVIQVGKEPVFDLKIYEPNAHSSKMLSAIRQVQKKGVIIQEFSAAQIEQQPQLFKDMNSVLKEWFNTRRAEKMKLISEVSPFKKAEQKKYFIATLGGQVEAFLACSPVYGRNGFFLHDLIRKPTALNGVSEALMLFALKELKTQGYAFASLGIASLAGLDEPGVNTNYPILNKILNYVFQNHETFMKFKSLYHFKKKFNPTSEEPAYLAFYPPRFKIGHALAISSMFSPHGLLGDMLYKWRRWSSGNQLPHPLQKLLSSDVVTLSRPVPFTFAEFISRCRFTCFMFFLNVYTYMNIVGIKEKLEPESLERFGFNYTNFLSHKWYVLVTSNFLHFDFFHLTSNMILLLIFCGTLEMIGGTTLAAASFLIGLNANIPNGLIFLPLLEKIDISTWKDTLNYLDVGASLGIMSVLGTLLQFFKPKKTLLILGIVITISQAILSKTYIGIDHAFALITGYGIGYLYLYKGFRLQPFQKLFAENDSSFVRNSVIPFGRHNRTPS